MSVVMERFRYDDAIVRQFLLATFVWGFVGMLVGLIVALQLAHPAFNLGLACTSFGRLRPLHTNAVIFAFAGNAIFAGVYYSTQRLLKARMFSRPAEPPPLLGLATRSSSRPRSRCRSGSRRGRSTPSSSGRSTSRSR